MLPNHVELRLLVVHVTSKNPRSATLELDAGKKDSYQLRVHKLSADAKIRTVFHEDEGDLIAMIDLLKLTSGGYEFLPSAEMRIHTGDRNKNGEADVDENSTSAIEHIEP